MSRPAIDLRSHNLGSIVTLRATSARGRAFLRRVGDGTALQYAEARYAVDILTAALAAGLGLQDVATGRRVRRDA